MSRLTALALLVLIGAVCLQCSDSLEPTKPDPQLVVNRTIADLTTDEKSLITAVNSFSLDLFQKVNAGAQPTKNVFVSPLSVSYALGITLNGANGTTRDQIAATLKLSNFSLEQANDAYYGLTGILTGADPAVSFRIANSFWSRLGKGIQPQFVAACKAYFNARVEEIDFQAPGAADTINQWVKDNTNGKIKEVIKAPISGDIAALLLNALYLKADWSYPFDTDNTKPETFYPGDGSEDVCQMMSRDYDEDRQIFDGFDERPIVYFANDLFQGARLPYGKEGFRMTVLLPDASITADALIEQLTLENWNSWQSLPTQTDFWLFLPKFKFEFETRLNDILIAMGMPAAFDPGQADFSNLFVDGTGWIDEVKHKTFVQVDEKGTEAAAVTAVWYADSVPPTLRANRPFVFVIHEIESGAILFVGKVVNPTLES